MPIKPENKARYPSNWKEISKRIRHERAEDRCECSGQCGDSHHPSVRCSAPNGVEIRRLISNPARWSWATEDTKAADKRAMKSKHGACGKVVKIVLTVAHLDHQPENCDDGNLLAMCQRCHNKHDAAHRAKTRANTRRAKMAKEGQQSLLHFNPNDG